MGNGVKVLLVALLIISVVVVAKMVQDDTDTSGGVVSNGGPTAQASGANPDGAGTTVAEPTGARARTTSARSASATASRPARSSRTVIGDSGGGSSPPTTTTPPPATPGTGRAGGDARPTGARIVRTERRSSAATEARSGSSSTSGSADTASRTPDGGSARRLRSSQLTSPPPSTAGSTVADASRGSRDKTPSRDDGGAAGAGDTRSPTDGENLVTMTANPTVARADQGAPDGADKTRTTRNLGSTDFQATTSSLKDVASRSRALPTPGAKETDPFREPLDSIISRRTTSREPGVRDGSSGTSADREFPLEHTVVAGDSYWRLAEKFYGLGKGKYYKTIQLANKNLKLIPGRTVTIPAPPTARRAAAPSDRAVATPARATSNPGATSGAASPAARAVSSRSGGVRRSTVRSSDGRYIIHTVKSGDTLSELAKIYYNNPKGFLRIKDANTFLHYQQLVPGQKIRIPVK